MATRAQTLYKKILRLKNISIRFVALEHFADIDDEGVIRLNLHKHNQPIRNFIHEAVHAPYPKLAHKKVYELEKEIWDSLSIPQKEKLYKKLFK